jgi:hypothetical protein
MQQGAPVLTASHALLRPKARACRLLRPACGWEPGQEASLVLGW